MSFSMDWYDWIRLLVASLSLLAMHSLGLSLIRRGNQYTPRLKDFWWSMNALLFCLFMGSVEQVFRDRGITAILFVNLLAVMVCLKAALSKNRALITDDPEFKR